LLRLCAPGERCLSTVRWCISGGLPQKGEQCERSISRTRGWGLMEDGVSSANYRWTLEVTSYSRRRMSGQMSPGIPAAGFIERWRPSIAAIRRPPRRRVHRDQTGEWRQHRNSLAPPRCRDGGSEPRTSRILQSLSASRQREFDPHPRAAGGRGVQQRPRGLCATTRGGRRHLGPHQVRTDRR
jgi:hypothetical protein